MAPRILLFGTGAIGSVYTWIFAQGTPQENIVTVCRSNFEAAKERGISIDSTIWGPGLHVQPTVVRSVQEAAELEPEKPFDYVIVCAKALSTTPSTADMIAPAMSPSTTIVLVQNGIGIEEGVKKAFPNNPLVSTVVYLGALQTSPGIVEHTDVELLHVGSWPPDASPEDKAVAKGFADFVTSCKATAKYTEDIQAERWSKIITNTALNPLCALTRSRDRQFTDSSPEALDLFRGIMLEVATIAQASGYTHLGPDTVDFKIGRVMSHERPGMEPSMMVDAVTQRSMEVDAIVGNVYQYAKEKNINTPLLKAIYLLLNGLNDSFKRTLS